VYFYNRITDACCTHPQKIVTLIQTRAYVL